MKKINERGCLNSKILVETTETNLKNHLFYQEYLRPALTQVSHAESVYFAGSVGEHPFPEQATSI